jgi:cytochrome c peroxidase
MMLEHSRRLGALLATGGALLACGGRGTTGEVETTTEAIQQGERYSDSAGEFAVYSVKGAIDRTNEFFLSLGTNGRACVTCHRPSDGMTLTPSSAQDLFNQCAPSKKGGGPSDPVSCAVFRTNDGSNSPNADVSTPQAMAAAYSMLLTKAVFRIGIGAPANAEFDVVGVSDPYGYATTSQLSLFRRPLPSTNLAFSSVIMWDGREPSLASQANDATLGHAQASGPLTPAQQASIVDLELNLFSAQTVDHAVGALTSQGAAGGPIPLSTQPFTPGENAAGAPSFTIYDAWANVGSPGRSAIARGQALFGTHGAVQPSGFVATCSGCHNAFNAGSRSTATFFNVHVADAAFATPDLPLYTLRKKSTGDQVQTTDPGRALITGLWNDVGRFKAPTLRNLAARAPYFHNGSAATLDDVVEHYKAALNFSFTDAEQADLVAFLNAL